jgi:hypothetical protein
VVRPADIVVGHSLGGLTIPLVEAEHHIYLYALRSMYGDYPLARVGSPARPAPPAACVDKLAQGAT